MHNFVHWLYKIVMAKTPAEVIPFNNKLAIVVVFLSFVFAFIIITTQFLASNISF